MAKWSKLKGFGFDDISIVPKASTVISRSEVDTSHLLGGMIKLKVPIISSCMDTITEVEMAHAMSENGGLGVLHRYAKKEQVLSWIKELDSRNSYVFPSIGASEEDFDNFKSYLDAGIDGINVDLAHGHSAQSLRQVERVADYCATKMADHIVIMGGNVATSQGVKDLAHAGATAIRVGVSSGAACSTRLNTGVGIPMITTIIDCCERKIPGISIIADGGVKNYGDVAKAIICGADAVMVGSMLSGTKECPSKAKNEDGEYVYRGMASTASQSEWRGYVGNGLEEGVSMVVKSKGPAKNVIEKMAAGLRSAMAYTGAYTIRNFHEMGEIMEITQSGFIEGLPHGLLNK